MMNSPRYPAMLFVSVALTGCAHLNPTSDWTPPAIDSVASWSVPIAQETQQPGTPWWQKFGDTQLDALMTKALRSNNDLAAAAIRVRTAQLQADLVAANGSPGLMAGANVTRSHDIRAGVTTNASGVSSQVSYELDLWGKLAGQRDVALWEAQATVADCQAAALSLTGTAVTLYWQLAELNQLVTMGDADVDYAIKTRDLIEAKYQAGMVSGLVRAQAGVNVANQKAIQTQLIQRRVETRHAMAVLLNMPPTATITEPAALPTTALPPIAAGMPAEVLANRPDVHAAEMRLRQTFANVELTRKSFYPSLSLTAGLNTASNALLNFVQNPVAILGAGLSLPFLHMDTITLSVGVSQSQYAEAVVNFRQRLHTALLEVEDALSARTQLMEEHEQLVAAKTQAANAEAMNETRFRSGFTEFQIWLDSVQVLRNADRSLAYSTFNQLTNEAKLYKALGSPHGATVETCKPSPASP